MKESSDAFLGRQVMSAESRGIGAEQAAGSSSVKAAFSSSQELATGTIADGLVTLLDQGQSVFDYSSLRAHWPVCSA